MKTIHIILGLCIVGIALVLFLPKATKQLGGISSNTCTASTTAWSVGPQEAKTVLPARANRLAFSLSIIGANTTGMYRLDSTSPTVIVGIPITASTTATYDEDYPYRGVVKAISVASTTMMVTECLY